MLRMLKLGAGLVATGLLAGTAYAQVTTGAASGITVNQQAVGNALDAAITPTATPASYSLLPELTLRSVDFQESTVLRYLRDFRAGGTGVNGTAGVTKPGSRQLGSFLVASGRTGYYDARGDRPSPTYNAVSVMGGIDTRFGARSLIGVTAGYDQTDARFTLGERNSGIHSWFAGGYGTLGAGPLYVDLYGTYGEANYDLFRAAQAGVTVPDFYAYTRSRTYLAGGSTGLSFQRFGVEFEPFAGIRYANLRIAGLNEGSGVGALSIGRDKYISLVSSAGIRAGSTLTFDGATIRPEVRGAWRHEFRNSGAQAFGYGLNANDGTTQQLIYSPTPLGRDFATVGGGFTVSGAASPISLVVDYNGEFGNGRHINGVTGGLRLTF